MSTVVASLQLLCALTGLGGAVSAPPGSHDDTSGSNPVPYYAFEIYYVRQYSRDCGEV